MRSYHDCVRFVLRHGFSGVSWIAAADRSTICAASGSTQKLNSAFGVWLPAPSGNAATAPPMITSRFTPAAKPGSCRIARARLVRGPMAAIVSSRGRALTARTRKSAAVPGSAFFRAKPPGGGGGASPSACQRP